MFHAQMRLTNNNPLPPVMKALPKVHKQNILYQLHK